MQAMSKAVSLLAISMAVTLSGSHVFAKTVGPSRTSQVKTSGTSAAPSGAGGGQDKRIYCYLGHCVDLPPRQPPGATGGNDPRGPNRGPGDPALHPK